MKESNDVLVSLGFITSNKANNYSHVGNIAFPHWE